MKRLIRKWLGLKDIDHYQCMVIERLGDPHPKEKEFQGKLMALADEYKDVPMFFMQRVKYSWEENDSSTFLKLPDDIGLHGLLMSCVFDGGVEK